MESLHFPVLRENNRKIGGRCSLLFGYSLMGTKMTENPSETDTLLQQAAAGDEAALSKLFALYRDRLRKLVRLRMDRRVQGRVDPSDVLQDAYLDISKRLKEYADDPKMPLYLWLRQITGQKLIDTHRKHLGAQMRDVGQEVSLYHGALPQATSVSLAAKLLGKMTSASRAMERAENQILVQEALNSMDPIDREILVLRHFEILSNSESAHVLGLSKSAASNRYIRALKRIKDVLTSLPGFGDKN
jgi:RNA polymerase sigma-70 factor (ECF subfamily)